jgi:tellurite resistance protein
VTRPQLTPYPDNSPEALLRVIAMFIVSDGEVADAELDVCERLGVLTAVGGDRETFAKVFDAYCDDLIAHAGTRRMVALADADWVEAILAPITDPARRRLLAQTLLVVARSDGWFADAELKVVRQMLDHWGLTLEDLA